MDGLDEITTTTETIMAEVIDGKVVERALTPEDLGLPRVTIEELAGGGPETNARIAREILEGKPGPPRDIVVANAAAALVAVGRAGDLSQGVAQAVESIDSGSAREKLSIVYQDEGSLYVADVGSGKVRRITDLEGWETAALNYVSPTFDPTGDTVLYNMPTIEGEQERYDLWSVPVTGGEPTLVRRAATFGDYSPDGNQIAFVEDGGFGDLFVAPTAGGRAQKLATGEIVVPRWSPDGTRIAYNDGSGGVYVVDVRTGDQTLVVESEHLPAWVDDDRLSLSP
jgi:Tol biopolymer transport system component